MIQVIMVHKSSNWNISKEKAEELLHKYIIEILSDAKDNKMSLSELILLLNQRTKHIKLIHNSKRKPFSVYLRCMYGDVINFIDNFVFYGIMKQDADIQIILMDGYLNNKKIEGSHLCKYKEWILIDSDDFVII